MDQPEPPVSGTLPPPAAAVPRAAQRVSAHLTRYVALYAFATVWLLMVMLFPTIDTTQDGPSDLRADGAGSELTTEPAGPDSATADTASSVVGEAGGPAAGAGGAPGATPAAARTGSGSGAVGRSGPAAAEASASTPGPVGAPATGTGVTRGGFECRPGVRQIPYSLYAAPCVAKFEGENGGATYRGVTKDTIKIVIRKQADSGGPNAQTVDEVNRAAGRPDRTGAINLLKTYSEYFNKTFELYGRKVVFEEFNGAGVGTEEAQSKGQENACRDANGIVSGPKAFGDVSYATSFIESQPFSECAKEYKLWVPLGAAYFPESFYQRWHPYVWNALTMECEQIGYDMAEYFGKRLMGKKARWAGDGNIPDYKTVDRALGIYVPDNDGYQRCINLEEKELAEKYNYKAKHRVNYQLDVSRFADQATSAVIQYKNAGVTTLQNSCDSISMTFLTQAADSQKWFPEWWIIGVASTDTDGNGRLYSQNQVNGHLFGMSQLGAEAKINAKDGEAYQAFKAVRPNAEPPPGFGFIYYPVVHIFNSLQAAGPTLTPENIAAGLRTMAPGGGSTAPVGTWSFVDDHTAIDDSREVYWRSDVKGYDGKNGAYLETYGGKRFLSGQWPAEEPPIYPST